MYAPIRTTGAAAGLGEKSKEPSLLERVMGEVQRVRQQAEARRTQQLESMAREQGVSPPEAELAELEAKGVVQASIDVVQVGTERC